jgi:hypothetical protein
MQGPSGFHRIKLSRHNRSVRIGGADAESNRLSGVHSLIANRG